MITKLAPKEIFVYGSNTAGRSGAGAALQAVKMFGAVYGVGEGLTGQCYAFPTLDDYLRQFSWSEVRQDYPMLVRARDRFYECARCRPDLIFLLTKVGCGLAGYPESYMKSLFMGPDRPANIVLPEDWAGKEKS
jgi:hypothetical protein